MTTENITVFENLSDNIISFESKEQFMRYYDKNKDTIDKMATRGLNTKFKIDGYKIGRKNKQLILFPIKQTIDPCEHHTDSIVEDNSEEFNQLNMKVDILTDKINKFDHVLKQIITLLSNLNPSSQSPSSYTSGVADIFARTGQNSYR